jgi:hypothetical protein
MSERLTRQSRLSLPARRCGTRPRLPRASPSSSVLPRRALCARSTSTSADGTGPTAEDRKDWWGSGLWRRDCFRVYGASCGFRVVVAALGPGGRPRAWGNRQSAGMREKQHSRPRMPGCRLSSRRKILPLRRHTDTLCAETPSGSSRRLSRYSDSWASGRGHGSLVGEAVARVAPAPICA